MRTIDLITKLQELVDAHEDHKWLMGEHEIVIDMFKQIECINDNNVIDHVFEYMGFSPNITIEKSADGVYDILNAWADE